MSDQAIAPHTKSRRVKRKKVQASDGWTIVTHAEQKGGAGGKIQEDEGLLRDARVTRMVEGLTVVKMQEDFKKLQARWTETNCAKDFREMLGKKKWDVKEAVCIGIGSFSLDWEHRHRSMWQLVLFLDVVNMASKDPAAISLYAQEPIFTTLDESFLKTLHITVVSNSIETFITDSSFVFAPFVDWHLLLPMFLKNKDPKLYVGNTILDDYSSYASTEEKQKAYEECNGLGKSFLQARDAAKIPEFELHAHALNGLMAYWKQDNQEEG
ncbi:hypothetical protein K504DRAFT_366688 [Pleomassaria siparia CBS 279.74]|uniref:SRR1-like domain-containing protein n=1 Tax=Pleomassaria siparia CBS 279.74 TaxID=1314801 RepID=A0A6G1KNR4_9PLEO|nr:hypothetical protein K504DRAFT_366688 [Pleomassaria siparia CBS 279.74]